MHSCRFAIGITCYFDVESRKFGLAQSDSEAAVFWTRSGASTKGNEVVSSETPRITPTKGLPWPLAIPSVIYFVIILTPPPKKSLPYLPSRREYTSFSWEGPSVWLLLLSPSSMALTYSISGTHGSFTRAYRKDKAERRWKQAKAGEMCARRGCEISIVGYFNLRQDIRKFRDTWKNERTFYSNITRRAN